MLILCGICLAAFKGNAQVVDLFTLAASSFDSVAGFAQYAPHTISPGQRFQAYMVSTGDTLNTFELKSTWEDSASHLHHYYHQQKFKGLRVESAVFKEHADETNSFLVYAHGMIADSIDGSSIPELSEQQALQQILDTYPNNVFAWMDSSWEAEVKIDLGDPNGTNFPQGELLWGLDSYANMNYRIPGSRYSLAWRFELFSVDPYFHRGIFVDANSGEIFREDEMDVHDGTGDTWYQGYQWIDSKQVSNSNFILFADDNTRNIHLKHGYVSGVWGFASNYTDSDDIWITNDVRATSSQWYLTQSWDFFHSAPYNYHVYTALGSGLGHELRVWSNVVGAAPLGSSSHFKESIKFHYIILAPEEEKAIDVVAHEFTHRIEESFNHAKLSTLYEPGAIREAHADIFGELIEGQAEGSIDWIHGDDPGTLATRNLANPKVGYFHNEVNLPCSTTVTGQPDTYLGDFWYTGACDFGGIHGNCGVMNYWFYLLAEGGSGTNDLFNTYNVQGIGSGAAGRIAFYAMENSLSDADGFAQARAAHIQAAQMLYGSCSNEEIQTTNAWYAAGVGLFSSCPVSAPAPIQNENIQVKVYPNPSSGVFTLDFQGSFDRTIVVTNALGVAVKNIVLKPANQFELDLGAFPSGIYMLHVQEKSSNAVLKLIKQ
jgi:bacillolysin